MHSQLSYTSQQHKFLRQVAYVHATLGLIRSDGVYPQTAHKLTEQHLNQLWDFVALMHQLTPSVLKALITIVLSITKGRWIYHCGQLIGQVSLRRSVVAADNSQLQVRYKQ